MNVIPFDKVKRDGFFFVNLPESKSPPKLIEVYGGLIYVRIMGEPETFVFTDFSEYLFCRVHAPVNCWFVEKKTWFDTTDADPVIPDVED